jgi:hypothetical protein
MRRMLVAVTVVMAWGGGLVATPAAVSAEPPPADHPVTVPFAGPIAGTLTGTLPLHHG